MCQRGSLRLNLEGKSYAREMDSRPARSQDDSDANLLSIPLSLNPKS